MKLLWVFNDLQHLAVGDRKTSCIYCSRLYMKEAVRFVKIHFILLLSSAPHIVELQAVGEQ